MKNNIDKVTNMVKSLNVDDIVPNFWNPNVMDEATLNRLADEIRSIGFIDPIQVVPLEDGKYMIIGGEHRWRVAKILGYKTIPCVVLSDEKFKDTDLQKFITVRLNVLHGKIDPEKFVNLYNEMVDKYGDEALRELMAFTDENAWKKLVGGVRDALVESGLPEELIQRFDETTREIKTIDNLSSILNYLFSQYGDTLKNNFMVFTYGKKEHIYIACNKDVYDKIRGISLKVKENQVDINDVLSVLFDNWESIDFSEFKKVSDDYNNTGGNNNIESGSVVKP